MTMISLPLALIQACATEIGSDPAFQRKATLLHELQKALNPPQPVDAGGKTAEQFLTEQNPE